MNTAHITLEQMAQEYAHASSEADAAAAKVAVLREPYKAACDALAEKRRVVEQMKAAIWAVERTAAIRRALLSVTIEFDGPLILATTPEYEFQESDFYLLCAVGSQGTGLYLHKSTRSGRYSRKQYAVPLAVAVRHGYDPKASVPHYRDKTSRDQEAIGLVAWQERGKGDFGHSGPYKPLAPPEGGRWRWLEVREQVLLEA